MIRKSIKKKPNRGYLTVSPKKRMAVISKSMLSRKSSGSAKKREKDLKNVSVVKDDAKSGRKAIKKEEKTEIITNKAKKNEMKMNEETLDQINGILDNEALLPKRNVKLEKKEKGLIERTDDSTILITEDNKTLLTD